MTIRKAEAYAKINLFLKVLDRRPDGYHNLESVMQSISLSDTVTAERLADSPEQTVTITCTDPSIPTDEGNIAAKCARAFFRTCGIPEYAVALHIEKRIPSQAGLGGGSADGAAVLRLLNTLYETHLDLPTLCTIGHTVGADIPFCLMGGTCLCTGIGEILTPVEIPTPSYHILVATPKVGISTPEAYRRLDECPDSGAQTAQDVILPLSEGRLPQKLHNSFESAILPAYEEIADLRRFFEDHGADAVLMSGSGSSVFALYSDETVCRQVYPPLAARWKDAFLCHAVSANS